VKKILLLLAIKAFVLLYPWIPSSGEKYWKRAQEKLFRMHGF